MRKRSRIRTITGILLLCAALFFCVRERERIMPVFSSLVHKAGVYSALAVLPEAGADRLKTGIEETILHAGPPPDSTPVSPAASSDASSKTDAGSAPSSSAAASSALSSAPSVASSYVPPPAGAKTGKVLTKFFSKSSANLTYQNIYVSNKTSGGVDLKKELGTKPNVKIQKNGKPMVLILHTHATEAFLPYDYGYYVQGTATRSTDSKKNICAVGDAIARQLSAAQIVTLHDKTMHDYPSYTGGYERSAATIKSYLKKYPTIQVVLDIHRDAVTYDNGDMVKPTAGIGGKKAAQIMICAGRQDGKVTQYPNWRQNLRFALRLQQSCETDYPGLARPLYFVSKRYNEYLLPGSLLIEMGSEGNTLEEAVYAGELLGKSLAKLLGTLK